MLIDFGARFGYDVRYIVFLPRISFECFVFPDRCSDSQTALPTTIHDDNSRFKMQG